MVYRLSIIVPTADGEGLDTLFASLDGQLEDDDEVLVIGDTCDGPLDSIQAFVEAAGHRYMEHNSGHHCWGHCQINAGMREATGDYLVFIDDDDCFTPDALYTIRMAAREQLRPRPMLFRFWSKRHGMELPQTHEVRESAIGGHSIVVPNRPTRLGTWGERYAGDYDFIVSTLAKWPEHPAWYDDVIACA